MILTLMLATNLAAAPTPAACENLKTLKLSNTTITIAEFVPLGAPTPGGRGGPIGGAGRGQAPAPGAQPAPGARGGPPAPAAPVGGARGPQPQPGGRGAAAAVAPLPAHCRVVASLKPSSDSDIGVEVWMPTDNWNGKFEAVGNSIWAGSIQGIAEMQAGLRRGYATAATDTGHTGGSAAFALGRPEKVIDFGYRAVHEMTVHAKALIKAFYNENPKYSYFNGCATGGRQALMEAQRYPEDFDGIIAGAPVTNHIYLHAAEIARNMDIAKDPLGLISAQKQTMLARAVVTACDELDMVKDNLISNPQACKFDPAVLLCKAGDKADCLTAPQVQTAKRIYAATRTSKGEMILPGYAFGGELGYAAVRGINPPTQAIDTFRYLAHQNANWDWRTFDLDKDVALAIEKAGIINATDPDLSKFKAHGGKLLLYHGWADPVIQPETTISYYSSVLAKMGRNQDSWLRLFMVPGLGNCQGGAGPNQFDKLTVMEKWRESNTSPKEIIATNAQNSARRPLCPYPQVALFKGPFEPVLVEEQDQDGERVQIMVAADADDATNFVCKTP